MPGAEGPTPMETDTKKEDEVKKDEKKDDKKKGKDEEEMSEEDIAKKAELDLMVERVTDADGGVSKLALEHIRTEIRTATSSMTSVPRPLKFLRPHYGHLKTVFEKLSGDNKVLLADILSVLAMTMAKEGSRESLHYKLQGSQGEVDSWGHEFVRNLTGEVGAEWPVRIEKQESVDDLRRLVDEIVPFHVHHNAEPEACDLLLEVESLNSILAYVDDSNYARIARYLLSCAAYLPSPEDANIYKVVLEVYKTHNVWADAVRVAIKMDDTEVIQGLFDECSDPLQKKQMAYIAARAQVTCVTSDDDTITAILSNAGLSEAYITLARDLDVWEAKTAEDIYKTHVDGRTETVAVDSARANLATAFVNALANAGFGHDKLLTVPDGSKWVYKNKEHGMMSAAASLGLIQLWDVDNGLSQIDKFFYATDDYIKAGAALAVGVLSSGVRNECDPALALLTEDVDAAVTVRRVGAIIGLGLAYAGQQKTEVMEMLTPVVANSETPADVFSVAALSLGLVYVGSCNDAIAEAIMQSLLEMAEASLNDTMTRFACLGLGLLFLGRQDKADTTLEALKAVPGQTGAYCRMTVSTCAYACTGNVMKAQECLHACAEHLDENNSHQAVAALGLALCAQSEELGAEMSLRMFENMLQYGEPNLRRVVPLCMGLLVMSNPKPQVVDLLSRLSHEGDQETAMGAILGLGFVGAGTNNARIAQLLRALVTFYQKDPNFVFIVRLAQGLVHAGKGLVSLNPVHSDRFLYSKVGLAGLLAVLHACLDIKSILLGRHHYMLFFLVPAMAPRMLMTIDENGSPVPVSVRVGQAVDTVGQAGRPKTITGFQTHTTPVLLLYDQRAEFATDEYIPATSVLEGFVIVKPNPDFVKQ